MNQKLNSLKASIQKNGETALVVFFLLLFIGFAYSLYFLFNRPVDTDAQKQILDKSRSANIHFDTKTVNRALELKNYNVSIEQNTGGKNPFLTY